jgi:hypothetical protein
LEAVDAETIGTFRALGACGDEFGELVTVEVDDEQVVPDLASGETSCGLCPAGDTEMSIFSDEDPGTLPSGNRAERP